MAGLNLRGDTSGSVEIVSPAVAGDNTITLPNDNGSANQFFKNSTTAGIVTHSSMVEDASGNIGIGTTTPTETLHVVGDARVTGILTVGTASLTLNGTDGTITGINTVNGLTYPSAGSLSNRNLIFNGAMQVWQREDGLDDTSVSNNFNEDYQTVDRFAFRFGNNAGGGVGIARTTDVPTNQGFSNAYKVGVETSVTPTTTMIIYPEYVIEAQDIRNSGWNYNDSNSYVTISFWVKSNKTGTYNLGVYTDDGTRQFFTNEYTINSSDTWERKEISIPGYTNIQFNNDNGVGLRIDWHLSIGPDRRSGTSGSWSAGAANFSTSNQVNFMDDTANEWYLTGVQLEVGTRATTFEHRCYGDELARCQRYFQDFTSVNTKIRGARYNEVSGVDQTAYLPVRMRAQPNVEIVSSNDGGANSSLQVDQRAEEKIVFEANPTSTNTGVFMQFTFTCEAEL